MRINKILFIATVFLNIAIFGPYSEAATFEITVDKAFIDFGFMEIGEFKEIKEQGDYHNEVTCKSDRGQTWYLKIHLVAPLQSGASEMPSANFKWKVIDVINGTGYAKNKNEFNSFSTAPMAVYTSSPEDNQGREVKIRFTYGLEIPQTQITGNYQCIMRYTFTETL